MLENHKTQNEETCEECKDTIATVSSKGKAARESRERTIRNFCQDCINDSPVIQQVPIKLSPTFERKQHILGELVKFSVLKFDRIESGKALPFTRPNGTKIGVKTTPDQIPLMTLSSARIKYDRKTDGLTVDVRCKDAKLDAGDDKEQAEVLREAYEDAKQNNMYVYIQAQETDNRYWKNWDNEEIDVKMCQKLSAGICLLHILGCKHNNNIQIKFTHTHQRKKKVINTRFM